MKVAADYLPGEYKCLPRAYAAHVLLAHHGHGSEVRVGVARDPQGKVEAHAWVECQGKTVLGEVENMRREHLACQMTVRADGSLPLDGAAPLLIQRSSGVNPVAALPPRGLLLRRLRIRHPAPSQVLALLAEIGLVLQTPVTVTKGNECSLVAEIQTPHGPRELGET